jgi:uncharacterized protein (DUF1697 family)
MQTYIALLRGINVSGQKKIIMAELREHLKQLSFSDIQTYIQSGNIIFKFKKTSPSKLETMISGLLKKVYDFEVPCIIRSKKEIENIISNNPFKEQAAENLKSLYFVLLKSPPKKEQLKALESIDYPNEYFEFSKNLVYLYLPNGAVRAKLSNNFFEKKLDVKASTRNLRTLKKLIELAEK